MILFFAKTITRTKRCVTKAQEKKMLDSQTKTRKYYQERKICTTKLPVLFLGPGFFPVVKIKIIFWDITVMIYVLNITLIHCIRTVIYFSYHCDDTTNMFGGHSPLPDCLIYNNQFAIKY